MMLQFIPFDFQTSVDIAGTVLQICLQKLFFMTTNISKAAIAIIGGLLVTETGLAIWTLDFTFLKAPVAAIVMVAVLYIYLNYFNGNWPADRTAGFRRAGFRREGPPAATAGKRVTAVHRPLAAWKRGLPAGLAIVLLLEAGIVLTFRLIPFPEAAFTSQYHLFGTLPRWQAWILVLISSLVAGICEETGFRGYMQVPLERLWGRFPAVLLTSVVFTLLHLGKAWSWYIIPLIFLTSVLLGLLASCTGSLIPCIIAHTLFDIVNFSYWWSHLAGSFRMATIFVSGIDVHFAVALMVFTLALFAFFRAIKKADP